MLNENASSNTMAVVLQALMIAGFFMNMMVPGGSLLLLVLAGILWACDGKNPLTSSHGRGIANFVLTHTLIAVALMGVVFLLSGVSMFSLFASPTMALDAAGAGMGGMFVFAILAMLYVLAQSICFVWGMVVGLNRAVKGLPYDKYPFSFRFFKAPKAA